MSPTATDTRRLDQELSPVEVAEVEMIGSALTREPAALFHAGELIWLASLAMSGGARRFEQLEKLRQLRHRVQTRRAAGWWLDPSDGS